MQLNTEVDAQHYEKLQQLQRATDENLRAILDSVIDDLYARHKVAVGRDVLQTLRNNGFIGCLHGDGRLLQDYKKKLDWSHKQ